MFVGDLRKKLDLARTWDWSGTLVAVLNALVWQDLYETFPS